MATVGQKESLVSGQSGRILLVVALGSMGSMLGRVVLSPLLPVIVSTLEITPGQAGLTLSVMWGSMALTQYPGGRLSDVTSRKTVLTISLGSMIVAGVLIGGALSYALFLAGGLIMGLGAGLFPPTANAYISELFVDRRGQAFGVNTAAINIGGVLSAGVAVVGIGLGGRPAVYAPIVVFLILVLVLLNLWSDEDHQIERVSLDPRDTFWRMISRARIRRAALASAAMAFAWQGAVNFLPTYLQAVKGYQPTAASNLFALLFVVGAIVTPLAGHFGDGFGYPEVATGLIALATVGLTGLVVLSDPVLITVAVVVFAVGLAGFWPVIGAYLVGNLSNSSMGGDLGVVRSTSLFIGALGPSFVGFVAGDTNYQTAFILLVPCFIISLLSMATLSGTTER